MVDIRQFVMAEMAKNAATGAIIPPEAGATVVADGAGGATWATTPATETTAVANQAQPLAPAGQRDLWHATTADPDAISGAFVYSADFDIIWMSDNGTGLEYSADGGVTFTPCVFSSPPSGFMVCGASPTVVVAADGNGPIYTSTDGINFTQVANLGAGTFPFNILWDDRLGLFFYTSSVNPARPVATSPDGVAWTTRAANILPATYARNASIVVCVSDATPYSAYSFDGIVWTNTPSTIASSNNIAWSEALGEFLTITTLTGEGFASRDGINWVSRGVIGPTGLQAQLMWVANGHNRWYLGHNEIETTNYSLWSTADSRESFVPAHLDGATPAPDGVVSIGYDASRDRFMIGLYSDPPRFAYSTPRPYDVKALSDNIRVRGAPVTVDLYSNIAAVHVDNTAVETSLTPSTNSDGSMVLQASQPVGMCVEFCFFLEVSSAAGDTLTLAIKDQAATLYSDTLVIPALTVKRAINIRAYMTIQAAATAVVNATTLSGTASNVVIGSAAYNPAIQNTLDITAQWGAAASTCTMSQMLIAAHFRNGA